MSESNPDIKIATFAGGCFWCTQSDFEKQRGVIDSLAGYTGGHKPDPTYEEVCSGRTGHLEAVQLHFNSAQISYQDLLDIFWKHVDPTDSGGQFSDRGAQYRTAIFYHNDGQRRIAEDAKQKLEQSGKLNRPVATEIRRVELFYPAEPYHQGYYKKNPLHYKFYRANSGRDRFIQKRWPKAGLPKAMGDG
jgi:peptide methionine sulfoxide reductase msrA/msrB